MSTAAQPARLPSEKDLVLLFPRAPSASIQALVQGEKLLAAAGILKTPERLAQFLTQVGHESAGLTSVRENLKYSAERLAAVWPNRFPTVAAARPYASDPAKLAEKVYGGRLGNLKPGDGARYIGRGWLQITGRENYRTIGKLIGVDLEGNPQLAETPNGALASAVGFWTWKGINALCDGANAVEAVTRKINGGLNGLDDRRSRYRLALDVINA